MFNSHRNFLAFSFCLLLVALSGCGDGSTSASETVAQTPLTPASPTPTPDPQPTPAPTPTPSQMSEITVSGVVATGAPCVDAQVKFPGVTTAPTNVRSASDGSYSVALSVPTGDMDKPLVVQAECMTSAGSKTLSSVVAPRASGTINVNPLTNLISALVSKSGDPTQLGTEISNGTLIVDAAAIAGKVDQVKDILLPALSALTLASTFDPIKGKASADGTGIDRLLDLLKIEITPEADNTSSVAITIKIKNITETDSQPIIRFTNVTPLDVIKLENRITAVSVQQVTFIAGLTFPAETAGLIGDFLNRMNACYATKPEARMISFKLTPLCDSAFVGGTVANFQDNGLRGIGAILSPFVGMTPSDSPVVKILSDAAGTQFTHGTYEYLRPDGVMGVSARKSSPDNTMTTVLLEAQVGADGKLGLSGNRYSFMAQIVPFAQRRTFLNQKNLDYLSTGVNISIPRQEKDGIPLTKVVVTPPANRIPGNPASFTLLPGASSMVLPLQDGSLNETSAPSAGGFLRLRTEYTNNVGGPPRLHPSRLDFGEYFASDLSESALKQFSSSEVWKMDFYLGGANSPATSQYYRLPARPLTISEFRPLDVPELEASAKTYLQSLFMKDEPGYVGRTPLTGISALPVPWSGSPEPIEQRVFGLTAPAEATRNIFFTDTNYLLFVKWQDRIVRCNNGADGDFHCIDFDRYAPGAMLMGVELMSRRPDGSQVGQYFSVLQLIP